MSFFCLSFDVEEWDCPRVFGVESPHNMSTVFSAVGCGRLLDLLSRADVRASFFVTGVFARNHPDIVERMVSDGHEVGAHGLSHRPLGGLSYDELLTDIKGNKDILEGLGACVSGFRCPRNMINPHLYGVLKDLDFTYDSSVHPAFLPARPTGVFQNSSVRRIDGVWEVPMSTLFGLPISWWWFRNVGAWYTRAGCDASLWSRDYCLLYFHPWEFADLPAVEGVPSHIYKNTGESMVEALEDFIGHCGDVNFTTISGFLRAR
jgi:hypothetical protein